MVIVEQYKNSVIQKLCNIISHYVTSYHIIWHHIMSHHFMSHPIISHHITLCHITTHHITPHHITSHNHSQNTFPSNKKIHKDHNSTPILHPAILAYESFTRCCKYWIEDKIDSIRTNSLALSSKSSPVTGNWGNQHRWQENTLRNIFFKNATFHSR